MNKGPSDETREMRLVGKLIGLDDSVPETSLPQFLASSREPESDKWSTWDEITIALHKITGEVFTDVSLRRWAQRYGIPEGTQRQGGAVTKAEYARALKRNGITI